MDTISQAFGLQPQETPESQLPISAEQQEAAEDKDLAKGTVRRLLQKSEDALDEIIEIAKATEHPRAFEVAKQLVDSTANLAKQLAELSKTESPEMKQTTNIANAQTVVFAGTPTELLQQLRSQKK